MLTDGLKKEVIILMAVYNGQKFIDLQLQSILHQSYTDWQLIIRDDGSTDDTCKIINTYTSDSRIRVIDIKSDSKGANANFSALYRWAKDNLDPHYLMFADQDDIWKPGKIEITLNRVIKAEERTKNAAVMAFGNIEMINEEGRVSPEVFKISGDLAFNKTLIQNYALGCTIMINKAFVTLMEDISPAAENHDYWVSLLASGAGVPVYIPEKLIQYRQHGKNVTSQGSGFGKRFKRFTSQMERQITSFKNRVVMLKAFELEYGKILSRQDREMLHSYLNSYQAGLSSLITIMFKYRIFKLGLFQNLGLFYCYVFYYDKLRHAAGSSNS